MEFNLLHRSRVIQDDDSPTISTAINREALEQDNSAGSSPDQQSPAATHRRATVQRAHVDDNTNGLNNLSPTADAGDRANSSPSKIADSNHDILNSSISEKGNRN